MFASRSSHFHDKENAHGSMSFAHRTPARGLGGGKDANLLGFKTGLRHPGGAGAGGGADKLTMTTRTGKGGEKKGGKGSGEDEGIVPQRLFAKTFGTAPSTSSKLPSSKSLTFGPTLALKDPNGGGMLQPKTPAPAGKQQRSYATPLPSATRTRRRSKQLHQTPPRQQLLLTPEGRGTGGDVMMDVSFELDGTEGMLGGVLEETAIQEANQVVQEEDDEIEYMPPSTYQAPFELPYEVLPASAIAAGFSRFPILEGESLPLVEIRPDVDDEWRVTSGLAAKDLDSDEDEFGFGSPLKSSLPSSSTPSASAFSSSSARPFASRSTVASSTIRSRAALAPPSTSSSSSKAVFRPVSTAASRPAPSSSTALRRPLGIAAAAPSALRRPLGNTTTSSSSRTPASVRPAAATSMSSRGAPLPSSRQPTTTITHMARKPLQAPSVAVAASTTRKQEELERERAIMLEQLNALGDDQALEEVALFDV